MLRSLCLLLITLSVQVSADSVHNCGMTISRDTPPERVITLNQHVTELLLALDLGNRMVGTAYMDDQIAPAYREAYGKIPVLSEKYPSHEVILTLAPDFIVGGFSSAFGKQAAGERSALAARGIDSFLSSDQCLERGQQAGIELLFEDIRQLGKIFAVESRAEQLIEQLQREADHILSNIPSTQKQPTVLVLDDVNKTAYSAACCGMAQQLTTLLGLSNISAAMPGNWIDLSWEKVVQEDPDWIILVDASWSSAASKRQFLQRHAILSQLQAVRQQHFITVPFSATVNSVRFLQHTRKAQQAMLNQQPESATDG